jgi:hypothetical protein
MSHGFDPIEEWLGAHVELLPAPAGTFERIHRRAKRRKAVVTMSTAAGVAVLIAAAATLPQFVAPPHPGGPARIQQQPTSSSHTHTRPGHHHRSSTPTPRQASPRTSNFAITGSTQPPTPGIAPSSVTFVSVGAVGAVIGQTTSGCPSGCEAVAATANYGRSWTKADAPPAGPPDGDSGVSQIRFLEPRNGWAYGPGLYVTHDGGATWAKASGVHGRVIDLATVNGSAYAVAASCTGTGSDYASGCTNFALYTSPYYSDSFQPVAGASGKGQVQPGGLQLTNGSGYLLADQVLFTGSPNGGPWQPITISRGPVPACLAAKGHKAAPGESGLLAPGAGRDVNLFCQGTSGDGVLYTSADAGATWQLDGPVRAPGTGTSLAVAPGSGTLVLATTAGICYSPDGRNWHQASLPGQAPTGGFSFAGMTTQQDGVAVAADSTSKQLYVTSDGGLTWQARPIS